MMGTSEIKIIDDPNKLTRAKSNQLRIKQASLGYQDESNKYLKELDLFGIQLFSVFEIENRTKITAANRRLAQWRVTWLIEHSTSH